MIMRLAVIIGGLFALRFAAVAGVALQHQRPVGVEPQRVAEIGARRVELERRDVVVVHRLEPAHFPGIDPGAKRLGLDAGLTDAAAREGFAEAVGVGAGDRGMAHPDLLVGPAFGCGARLRSPDETASTARHRPSPLASTRFAVTYHHSMRNSGCGPWSAGKANVLPGTTGANPSALSPSPAKPCASAPCRQARERAAPPMKPRRDIRPLPLIGKNLDQARRLHARQPDAREAARRSSAAAIATPSSSQQLQREDMKRQPPAERLHIHDRDQAPRHQQTQRQRQQRGDQRHRHRLQQLDRREPPPRDADRP